MITIENLNRVSGIYSIIHRDSGMCYVGSSVNIAVRNRQHINQSKGTSRTALYRAIREFGTGAFDFEVLEKCDRENLLDRERFYIVLLNSASVEGFNTYKHPTATYHRPFSEVTRARIRAARILQIMPTEAMIRGGITRIGYRHSKEAKAKVSAARLGQKLTAEHKYKLRLAKLGKTQCRIGVMARALSNTGKKRTPETLGNMRRAQQLRRSMEYDKNRFS